MRWSEHFPDDCPPEAAQPVSGEVYRFVNKDLPEPEDFRSWREQNPHQPCPKSVTECQACGLSVFTIEEGVCTARNRVPALRKKKIALGNLTSDLGVILNTPSRGTGDNHHTWWVPADAEPWVMFQVVSILCSDSK